MPGTSENTPQKGATQSRALHLRTCLRRIVQAWAAPALVCALLAGCHSTPPPTPLEQLNSEQRAGYDAFQTHCAVCHNERVNEPKNGPALIGVFKKPYLPSGAPANDDRVTSTILHGRGMMPAQPYLDPETLNQLLAYLHTV